MKGVSDSPECLAEPSKNSSSAARRSSNGFASRDCPRLAQQAIEDDEGCRCLDGKPVDPALGRVQPHLQRIEGEPVLDRDDEFAVEHEGLRGERPQVFQDLGEEARQRFAGFGLDLDFIAGAKGKAAKAVPFGLELPAGIFGQLADQLGFHRFKVERDA